MRLGFRKPHESEQGRTARVWAVVIEKALGNYAAYVPDLPGCVSTGKTLAEVENNIREAIQLHLEGMKEDGIVVPPPSAVCEYVEA
jgi:predicted RNase H-like HicB family nuclease